MMSYSAAAIEKASVKWLRMQNCSFAFLLKILNDFVQLIVQVLATIQHLDEVAEQEGSDRRIFWVINLKQKM